MASVYITFGQIHVHSVNGKTFDRDCVAEIKCKSYEEGRKKAFEFFGDKWHNCYAADEFNHDILSYYPRGVIDV